MRRMSLILICCSLICVGAYRWGDVKWENAKETAMEYLYTEIKQRMTPYFFVYEKDVKTLVYEDVEHIFLPMVTKLRSTKYQAIVKVENESPEADTQVDQIETELKPLENTVENQNSEDVTVEDSVVVSGPVEALEKKVIINRGKLQEFDYLRQNFYQVDNTTTVGSDLLDANQLLGKDMTLKQNVDGPQILIYHTHSQEGYKDSIPGDPATSIVGVGDYLEQLLEQKYGISVLHHKGVYDLPTRDNAYSTALPNLEEVLKENPTIEVVIDLHRDGVAENRHLVTEVDGKPTAKIMFFNGLCKTTSQGELTYLPNPYIADNLALSFQMQLAAEEYYPGLMRKIYLKGYRYNLHLKPKSMLIEVGAQTNTLEEAKNAMEPLANILALVLTQNDSTNEAN